MRLSGFFVPLFLACFTIASKAEAQIQRFHIGAPLQGVDFYIQDATGSYSTPNAAALHIPATQSLMILNTDPAIDAGIFGTNECSAFNQFSFSGYRVEMRPQGSTQPIGYYYHCLGFLGGDTKLLRQAGTGAPIYYSLAQF